MRQVKLSDGKMVTLDTEIQYLVDKGALKPANNNFNDADLGLFFQRQLEHIKVQSYDVLYADLKYREIFPVSNDGGKGVTSITYRTYDHVGKAKVINGAADDLPRADVSGKETTIPVKTIGSSYGYTLMEIQSSQLTGAALDQRRANSVRRSIEELQNEIAFVGSAADGLGGFFDNASIPTGAVVNPGSGTEWVNKTPDQILFDVNDLFADIFETTNMVERGNTLLVPPAQWSLIMSTARSANSDTTIAQYLVNNSPYLNSMEDIVPLNECAAANNTLLSTDAMVAYTKSPDKLQLEIPVDTEFLPVQEQGLEFVVPVYSNYAGLNVYYPLSAAIATGI